MENSVVQLPVQGIFAMLLFQSSWHHPGFQNCDPQTDGQLSSVMEKSVTHGQNKHYCTSDARDQKKKIKLEIEESKQQQEDEEEDELDTSSEFSHPIPWQKIEAEGLDCDYALLFPQKEADLLFKQLEEEVVYSTGTASNPFTVKTR